MLIPDVCEKAHRKHACTALSIGRMRISWIQFILW